MKSKLYVGLSSGKREVFRSPTVPTHDSHGARFNAVVGPFRTRAGADFLARYGGGNPHCQCVADAERLARIPQNETVNGHPIRCYDNGGRSADRYTVIYMDAPEHRPGTFGARGMDDRPFHPQGFGMYCDAMPGRHIGRRVLFSTLPPDCQRAVLQDLTPTA